MIITPPPPVKFECPQCGQPIEAHGDMRGDRIKCPGCGAEIRVVESRKNAPTATVSEKPNLTTKEVAAEYSGRGFLLKANELYGIGGIFNAIAWISFAIGCLCLLVSAAKTSDGSDIKIPLEAAGGCFGLFMVLYVITQLLHIRALLHRQQK